MLVALSDTLSHCSIVADRPLDAVGSRTNILRSTTLQNLHSSSDGAPRNLVGHRPVVMSKKVAPEASTQLSGPGPAEGG